MDQKLIFETIIRVVCPRDDLITHESLPAIIVACAAVIVLFAMRDMTGSTGQVWIVAAVRIPNKVIRLIGDIIQADVALCADGVFKLTSREILVIVARDEFDPRLDLRGNVVIAVTFLALNTSLRVNVVKRIAGQVGFHITVHDMASFAELRIRVALVKNGHAAQSDQDASHEDDIRDNAYLHPVRFLFNYSAIRYFSVWYFIFGFCHWFPF